MSDDRCPICGADLEDDPIPDEWRQGFGGATHYSRRIAIYDRERDRTVAYRCPDCGGEWER